MFRPVKFGFEGSGTNVRSPSFLIVTRSSTPIRRSDPTTVGMIVACAPTLIFSSESVVS